MQKQTKWNRVEQGTFLFDPNEQHYSLERSIRIRKNYKKETPIFAVIFLKSKMLMLILWNLFG